MADSQEIFTYYQNGRFGIPWCWKEKTGVEGCRKLNVEEFPLSTARTPPSLRDQPPPPPKPTPAPVKREKKTLIESSLEFHEWLNAPSAPQQKPAPAPEATKPRVKPFDMQDIPDAMERIGWPMSAKIMRKWFAGDLNYANTDTGAIRGINQNGKPFPAAMVDTTTFELRWILGFARARAKFDELVNTKLFDDSAYGSLKKIAKRLEPSPLLHRFMENV
ncbi:hypothetical protein CNECB9_5080003 [Cupriavidus necator]|uniref:Uncharacterized protein n=1 Tax=Cupriavidus necator TaxID=106590 RepID=A0A1K0INX9_CUPNE|nr:hypothetical protein CNECB9_5080003 [Cupriavidus necator]